MPEIIVVVRKDLPKFHLLYVNHRLIRSLRPENVSSLVERLEDALGVKSKKITVRGRPKHGETMEAGYYRLAKMYLGYRASCIEKRRQARVAEHATPVFGMLDAA